MSDFLWPHESQHARPPCPSPTPGVHSNSRPLSLWCHPAISSSVVPFSSCPQSLPASESFPMTHLDSILKSRDITLPTKVHLVKAMVFPVVMYGCESWTVKKAERRRIDSFDCGAGEDSWESLGLQGDPTVHSKGDQSWVFFGRNDAKAETPVLWPLHEKSWPNYWRIANQNYNKLSAHTN